MSSPATWQTSQTDRAVVSYSLHGLLVRDHGAGPRFILRGFISVIEGHYFPIHKRCPWQTGGSDHSFNALNTPMNANKRDVPGKASEGEDHRRNQRSTAQGFPRRSTCSPFCAGAGAGGGDGLHPCRSSEGDLVQ